ncbi:putative knottin, scorpion toxin [Lupinus albus]|uniref:Putative knottin, scorpion toxin n=1 Tax=Lupinus albus TaxID=3870 RepID=A0A6A4P2Y5_LUPAL|nr:putative knottin, scorpion toxin [Lupinus albus]
MEKNLMIAFLVVLLTVTACYGEVETTQISTNSQCRTNDDCIPYCRDRAGTHPTCKDGVCICVGQVR